MRLIPLALSAAFVFTLSAGHARAQYTFADFATASPEYAPAFAVAFPDGAASRYFFRFSIAANGTISGSGVRYDFSASSASASPLNGKPVRIVSDVSRLGNPIRVAKNSSSLPANRKSLICPFSLKLSDGAIVKGFMTADPDEGYYFAPRMAGGTITYKGAVGSDLYLLSYDVQALATRPASQVREAAVAP